MDHQPNWVEEDILRGGKIIQSLKSLLYSFRNSPKETYEIIYLKM